ncbi:MAG: Decarbamoylnovobiocin carbamoyltransferase [Lentisphaerae bacterium ADurb.BinA184]|nr:MAG: Decarbamoylnovobiocin carbamoyltransferase [Lentisphaerae bacterium ADurb.BinA184]
MTHILGISAFYHDSAAALVRDGEVIAATQEERFTRVKHDDSFPRHAAAFCLEAGGIGPERLDAVVFYEKPLTKFHRLLETYAAYAPAGFPSFRRAMPLWLGQKLFIPRALRTGLGGYDGPLLFTGHHESHAASAFLASPFRRAAILTVDGVGEWSTAAMGRGEGNRLRLERHIRFPHSLGLLYSAFTYYTGFRVNSGEYKVMGLAPYGDPDAAAHYAALTRDHLLDLRDDGSFRLDMRYFNYCQGLTMTGERFHRLFGGAPRPPEARIRQKDMDLAAALQIVTEEAMLRLARFVRRETGERCLCMAGGVALNCVGNGRLVRESGFERLFFQPAAGDAGGALGAALFAWHQLLGNPRETDETHDRMQGALLGPAFSDAEVAESLRSAGAVAERHDERGTLLERVVDLLCAGQVVGFFQGRMEFGPRALGARSILGDARHPQMQSTMNLKIKFRESFRPFAPIVLEECAGEYFDLPCASPYMLRVGQVQAGRRLQPPPGSESLWGIERLNLPRSDIPAVTHVDGSARIQTVDGQRNPLLHSLLERFRARTGCAVLVNTSFNVRGEPIVCTPREAYRCFMSTGMDALAIGNHLLLKERQPPATVDDSSYVDGFRRADDTAADGRGGAAEGSPWRAPAREVRVFGLIFLAGMMVLGLVAEWRRQQMPLSLAAFADGWRWPWRWWLPGAAVAASCLLAPRRARPLYGAWTCLGRAIGWMVQSLALGVVFFGLLTPLGLLYRRWCGVITRRPDRRRATYWEPMPPERPTEDYYRLY